MQDHCEALPARLLSVAQLVDSLAAHASQPAPDAEAQDQRLQQFWTTDSHFLKDLAFVDSLYHHAWQHSLQVVGHSMCCESADTREGTLAASAWVANSVDQLQQAARTLLARPEWPVPSSQLQTAAACPFESRPLHSGDMQVLQLLSSPESCAECEDLLADVAAEPQDDDEAISATGGVETGWTCLGDSTAGGHSNVKAAIEVLQSADQHLGRMVAALQLLSGFTPAVALEDVLACRHWPALCCCIHTLLSRTNGSSRSASEPQWCAGGQLATAVEVLVMELTKECCSTSVQHAVQLWLALCPSLCSPLPAACLNLLQGPGVPSLSDLGRSGGSGATRLGVISLSLLRCIVQDWHFLSPQQHCAAMTQQLCGALTQLLQQPDTLTPVHLTLLCDPCASWMQRMCTCLGSHTYMAATSPHTTAGPVLRAVDAALNSQQGDTAPRHYLHTLLLQAVACGLLSLPDALWAELYTVASTAPDPGKANTASSQLLAVSYKQDILARLCAHLLHTAVSQSPGSSPRLSAHVLDCASTLLSSLTEAQPSIWRGPAQDALIRLVQASSSQAGQTIAGQHLSNLCANVLTAQAKSVASTQALSSSSMDVLVHTALQAAPAASAHSCQLVKAVMAVAGHATSLDTCADTSALLAQQLLQLLSQAVSSEGQQAEQATLDLVLHLVCHLPCVIPQLEASGALPQLVAYLVQQYQLSTSSHVSAVTHLACAANLLAISQSGQTELIRQGWLHRLLLSCTATCSSHPSTAAQHTRIPPSALSHPEVHQASTDSVVSCLSWVDVHVSLLSDSTTTDRGCDQVHTGRQVLQLLVSWLDGGLYDQSQPDASAGRPGQAPDVIITAPAPAQLALRCLGTWMCLPAALTALDAATNIRWYLKRLLDCARVSSGNPGHDTDQQPAPGEVVACDDDTQVAVHLLCNLVRYTTPSATPASDVPALLSHPGPPGPPSEHSAICSVVKSGAGMPDPVSWLHAAQASLRADIWQTHAMDVQSLGLLLQRCVLVAWPGICAAAPTTQEASWAGVQPAGQVPWKRLGLAKDVVPVTGGQPSPASLKMVHSTWSALTQGGTAVPTAPDLQHLLTQMHVGADQQEAAHAHTSLALPDVLDAASLAIWLDRLHSALTGSRHDANGGQGQGDAFTVLVGMLLGQGSPGRQVGGHCTGVELLAGLMKAPAAAYLWPRLAHEWLSGTTVPRIALCTAVSFVLQQSEPTILAALGGRSGVGLTCLMHHVVRWLGFSSCDEVGGLAWCGVLPGQEVVMALMQHVINGPDYLVYGCVAMLKQVEDELKAAAKSSSLVTWLASNPLHGCTWSPVIAYMDELCTQHRNRVLPFLLHSLNK